MQTPSITKRFERRKIGEVLVELGVLTQPEVERILELMGTSSERFGETAIREGMLDLGAVVDAKGLGAAIEPDTTAMELMPKAAWPPG